MKVLIKNYIKNIFELKGLILLLLSIIVMITTIGALWGTLSAIILPILLTCYAVNKADNKKNEVLFSTLPINKDEIVISKYLFVFSATVSMIVLTYLISLFKGSIVMSFRFDSVYIPFTTLLIVMSIYLPFRFTNKFRLPKIINYIGSFPFAYYLIQRSIAEQSYSSYEGGPFIYETLVKIYKKITGLISLTGTEYYQSILKNYYQILMILAVLIFITSMIISIKIYRYREIN